MITLRGTQARHRAIESCWFAARRASIAWGGRDHAKSAEEEAGFALTVPAQRGRTAEVEEGAPIPGFDLFAKRDRSPDDTLVRRSRAVFRDVIQLVYVLH